ncbi:hypothetical protein ACMD2_20138 [Ananas comosus]|uniref:DUF7812 domain-containing protein n=1 Tax=Ananas comosus TaxID=4615 RepID=A0A199VR23_ANACO|nr:hypothetical protein ACMD2_20138 [Ananas comosus]
MWRESCGSGFLAEDAKLLLRCCLSAFRLLEFDLSLVVEVCEVLLVELRRVFECDIGRLDSGDIRVNHAFSTAVVEGSQCPTTQSSCVQVPSSQYNLSNLTLGSMQGN